MKVVKLFRDLIFIIFDFMTLLLVSQVEAHFIYHSKQIVLQRNASWNLFFPTHKTNNYGGEKLLCGLGYFGIACQRLKT